MPQAMYGENAPTYTCVGRSTHKPIVVEEQVAGGAHNVVTAPRFTKSLIKTVEDSDTERAANLSVIGAGDIS